MDKLIDITLFGGIALIVPKSGSTAWFQEDDSPDFYVPLKNGPEELGRCIRISSASSRNLKKLGIPFPRNIVAQASKKFSCHLAKVSELTGVKENKLHDISNNLWVVYTTDNIILRFKRRSPDQKFHYQLINKELSDEPHLAPDCSDLELGQKIFDWANSLDLNT
jgi:hypothetical protein